MGLTPSARLMNLKDVENGHLGGSVFQLGACQSPENLGSTCTAGICQIAL